MQREIVGFHEDGRGGWVAELACGHQRHVRHDPPFRLAPWVVDEEGRRGRIGSLIECGLCAATRTEPSAGDRGAQPTAPPSPQRSSAETHRG